MLEIKSSENIKETLNNTLYQLLLDETTAMITIIDAKTFKILYANKAALNVTGPDYIGSVCYKYIHHQDTPCPGCILTDAVSSGEYSREVSYGGHVYNQIFKLVDWDGQPALMEYSEDITAQKRELALAKERSDTLTNILSNVPTGIIVYSISDEKVSILNANPAVGEMMSFDSSAVIGAEWEQIVSRTYEEDIPYIVDIGKKLAIPETTVSFEFRFYKDKNRMKTIWISATGHSVQQPDGSVTVYVSYTDVTAQKLAEKENIALSQQTQDVFDQIPSGICMYQYQNGELSPLVRNKGFWKVFGSKDKADRNPRLCVAFDQVHPDDSPELMRLLAESLSQRTPLNHTYRIFDEGSRRYIWVRIVASVVSQKDSTFLYANYFNVTERVKNDQMLENIIHSMSGGFAAYRIGTSIETIMFTDGLPKMHGYTRSEYGKLSKENPFNLVYETDRARLHLALTDASKANKPLHISFRVCCKDKRIIWVNLSAYPAETSTPKLPVYNCVFTNVSEQFALYQNIIENTEDGIIVADQQTQEIYYANDIALQMTGSGQSGYTSKKSSDLLGIDLFSDRQMILPVSSTGRILQVKSHSITWMGQPACVQYLTDITDVQTYQHLLEQEKERYRLVIEKSGIALMDYEHTTGKVFVNESYSRYALSQISPNALMHNEGELSVVHPDDLPVLYQFFANAHSKKSFNQVKLRLKMKDGSYRWTVMTGLYFYDKSGSILRDIAIFQDVDEVTSQFEELKSRYEYELAQKGYVDENVIETLTFNVTAHKVLDYQSELFRYEDLFQNKHMQFHKLSNQTSIQEKLRALVDADQLIESYHQGITPSLEYQRQMPDSDESIWVRADVRIVREPQSGDLLAFVYTYNIDRPKYMDLISQRLISTNYEIAYLISAKSETIKYSIGKASYMADSGSGVDYKEIISHVTEAVDNPESSKALQSFLSVASICKRLETTAVYSKSIPTDINGQSFCFRWTAVYFDEQHDYILLTLSDISDVYQEEQKRNHELKEALKNAEIASKAKTDFLSRMSHDMRTPMNGILGLTNLLQDRTDPADIQEDIVQIKLSGQYLLNLINDTLDMSKIDSGKLDLHPVPLYGKEVLENILANAKILAKEKNVLLSISYPEAVPASWPPVLIDSARLEQVFMNIISNAIKFTPKGGTVFLQMDTLSITEDSVTDHYTIRDTGIGMSEDFLQHIYEPFSQEGRMNTERENGTGLGLAIVRQLVDLMNGQIEIKSQVDVGTEVSITLTYPRYYGSMTKNKPLAADLTVLSGKRVLLCEDHPLNAQIATRLLLQKQIETVHAENGQIGVEYFSKSAPGYFDWILMDIRMPVMNGLETAKAIRELPHPDAQTIPIIAMTANAFEDDIQESMKAGMNAHLAKPVNPEKLFETLASQIHQI